MLNKNTCGKDHIEREKYAMYINIYKETEVKIYPPHTHTQKKV